MARYVSEFGRETLQYALRLNRRWRARDQQILMVSARVAALKDRITLLGFLELLKANGLAVDESLAVKQQELAQTLSTERKNLSGLRDEQSFIIPVVAYSEVLDAIQNYIETHGVEPEVDPDLPEPDELDVGLFQYERLLLGELKETREFLSAHEPEALERETFLSAENIIQSCCGMDGC